MPCIDERQKCENPGEAGGFAGERHVGAHRTYGAIRPLVRRQKPSVHNFDAPTKSNRPLAGAQKETPPGFESERRFSDCEEGISMRLNPLVDLATTYSPAS